MLSTNEAATLYIDQEDLNPALHQDLNPAELNLQSAALMTASDSAENIELCSIKKTDWNHFFIVFLKNTL